MRKTVAFQPKRGGASDGKRIARRPTNISNSLEEKGPTAQASTFFVAFLYQPCVLHHFFVTYFLFPFIIFFVLRKELVAHREFFVAHDPG